MFKRFLSKRSLLLLIISISILILFLNSQVNRDSKNTFKTITGQNFNFDSLNGKVSIINFWATWCGPCLVEIPNLIELKNEYKDKPFQIIGISTDDYLEDVMQFNEYQPFNYPVIMANKQVYEMFPPPMGIPFTIVLDKNGNVAKVFVGYVVKSSLVNEIEKLF